MKNCIRQTMLTVLMAASTQLGLAQSTLELHKMYSVTLAAPVDLRVQLSAGDLQVAYSRDGQVSVWARVQVPAGRTVPGDFLEKQVVVEVAGNHLDIRDRFRPDDLGGIKVVYIVDVPYRTAVRSALDSGKQTIMGVTGPIQAESHKGNISVSYVSDSVVANTGSGDLDFQVIGGHIAGKTGSGNISCSRSAKGIDAETGEGDISLMVVGPSIATVKHGTGRIDAGGMRGALVASTDAGELHVKAVPHDDWQLTSTLGDVRVELPPAAKFDVDATTIAGEVVINRDDLPKPTTEIHHFAQKAKDGGKRIEIRTEKGKIVIS